MNDPLQPGVRLSVSIVLYNSDLGMLGRVLASLEASARVAQAAGYLQRLSVTLVDNASGGRYQQQLDHMLADGLIDDSLQIRCILLSSNTGFGCGHNTAIDALTSDLHLVLNPDVELEREALHRAIGFMTENEDVVLLSPKVFGRTGEQAFLCKRYPSVLVLLLRGFAPWSVQRLFRGQLDRYEMRDVCSGECRVNVPIASGCFMLIRTQVLRTIDGFDENFFLYFEDFDLSLRLEEQGRLVFDPAVKIIHHGGYAARKGWQHLRYFVSSGIMFFNRYGWRWL
ncbi:MAG: glycosyltransferase family 2 protein [Halioglobus sp.]|nr:glycosyltransferase family 2 protein [Halioglobus sp.]